MNSKPRQPKAAKHSSDVAMERIVLEDALERSRYSDKEIETIVRAVNSHEDLLNALTDLSYDVQDLIKGTALAERVKRVLAKAEGRERSDTAEGK